MTIEAMKQALEALELCDGAQRADGVVIYTDQEIAALRQAIAEAEKQEPVAWINAVMEQAQVFASAWSLVGGRFDDGSAMDDAEVAKNELRQMLATPPKREQERFFCERCGKRLSGGIHTCTPPAEAEKQEPYGYFRYDMRLDAWVQSRDSNKGVAFYTHPPKREWQGLTDEEYRELHLQMGAVYFYQDYGRAIEAKLKEKNT
jgi:hypothetical protein